jgi:hypothetical protein
MPKMKTHDGAAVKARKGNGTRTGPDSQPI